MQIMSWLARLAYVMAAISAASILLSGPLFKMDVWSFGSIFQVLQKTVPLGLIAIVILLITRLSGASGNRAILSIVVLAAILYMPISNAISARKLPAIHDITTDINNPPLFSPAMITARADAKNPPEYLGGEVATQQSEAYPDIQPITLAFPPAEVMARILVIADQSGWAIINYDEMSLEATHTTFWFGFKDDVIIRLQAQGAGTRVDIRSKSRIGRSDIGKNAARIRHFTELLQAS